MAEKFQMTQEGYEEALKKLDELTKRKAEIVVLIAEARSHGDLSENAEYAAAKDEQTTNEREIAELKYRIENAEIMKTEGDNSTVHFGSVVTVFDEDLGEEDTYTIKGSTEVDLENNVISNESPLGQALLGAKQGQTVTVEAPNGAYELKIVRIETAGGDSAKGNR